VQEEYAIPKMSRTAEFGREQERSLKRMKLFATGLLVLMAVVCWVSRMLQSRYPLLGFVAAFSEAGTIGALADWFAVVALFRHPLNLPIPRTAVIPRNRDRIGESLARFIKDNFLTRDLLEKKMATVDLAGFLTAWLSDAGNARFIARAAAEYIPPLLRGQGGSPDSEGRGGLDSVNLPLFRRVLASVGQALSGIRKQGRSLYQRAAGGRTHGNGGGAAEATADKPVYTPLVWKILKEKIMRDLANPDSDFVQQVAAFIRDAGQKALADEDLKERINRGLRTLVSEAVDENKELFALFISETVKKWDPEATSRRIELYVGKDLQWIRINGTIVGGLAGLLIYLLSFVFRGLG